MAFAISVVEPLAVFGMAMLSYFTAELFHWSGIVSLIACGLAQAHYSFKNISKKSYTTVKYFIKMLRLGELADRYGRGYFRSSHSSKIYSSSTSDCIIFLFLGVALVQGPHMWDTGFVVWTIGFTLVCRFLGERKHR